MTSSAAISGSRVFPPPAKCAWISFLASSAFITPFMFFVPIPQPGPGIWFWPGCYLYCGLLSVVIAGLMHNGFRALFVLGMMVFIFMICGAVGTRMLIYGEGAGNYNACGILLLRIAIYLSYFVALYAVILSVKGWIIGMSRSNQSTPPLMGE